MRLLVAGDARAPHLIRFAEYFRGQGHEVAVASAEVVPPAAVDFRIRVIAGPGFIRYASGLPSFLRIIREFRPELLSCHFLPNYGWLGKLSGFHPLAVSLWGSDILISAQKSSLHRWRARTVLGDADLVTADAEVLSKAAVRLCPRIKHLVTVPYGIPRVRVELAVKQAAPSGYLLKLVSIRRLEKLYRVDLLLAAMQQLERRTRFEAIIAGDGSQSERLQAYAAELGLKQVAFPGRLGSEQIFRILAEADIYVSCSSSDSTSVSLLEAMAGGAFPVVTDLPGNREWIQDGDNGLLFKPGDANDLAEKLYRAASDSALRSEAAKRNRGIVRSRAIWEDNMALVEKEFQALAAGC